MVETRLALIAADSIPMAGETPNRSEELLPKPIVIDRFQFKNDKVGYLRRLRSHL